VTTDWQIILTNWSKLDDQNAIKTIREHVFIIEQNVPVELEWDELDAQCMHCLVSTSDGKPIATARLFNHKTDAHIGRMAVLKPYRKQGIGTSMLTTLVEQARINNVKTISLNAQTTAVTFYKQIGFVSEGDEFDDAGIPHFKMTLQLGKH